jgi:hypothetical protein
MVLGLIVGVLFWWATYDPGEGFFQSPQLILVPAAAGIFVVAFRNKRKKLGRTDVGG